MTEISAIKERVRSIPVCLVIPPSGFLADERVFPSLGILKVASALRENGNPVEILDLAGYANIDEIIREYVSRKSVRHYGITATTPQLPAAIQVLESIRASDPDAFVILGGPHVTLSHAARVQDERLGRKGRGSDAFGTLAQLFDRLVVGDGELAIFAAIDPSWPDGVVDAGSTRSPLFLARGTLDTYPPPARDLIDLDSYRYEIDGQRAFSVIAQLGCPFECGFCGGRAAQSFRIARARDVSAVIGEIDDVIRNYPFTDPVSAVMFYDDEMNVVPSTLENLCRNLIELQDRLGLQMRFRGFVKAELFTPEQARLMAEAGFRVLLSGVESGSDKILTAMRKKTSREINTRCLNYARDAGLKFKALMSLGHPGESRETVAESVEWVITSRPDDVDWTIITEYPGSPYFDLSDFDPERNAWVYTEPRTKERLWSEHVDFSRRADYYKGVPGEYSSHVWTDYLSAEELVAERDKAEEVTRTALGLPEIRTVAQLQFEHSMGQSLPQRVLLSR